MYEGYNDTIEKLATRPFDQPIAFSQPIPSYLESGNVPFIDNVDGAGTSIDQFASDLLRDLVNYGKSHFLVDMPDMRGVTNRREELELGARPYFVRIKPSSLIGWRVERFGTQEIVSQVRILEDQTVADGEFGEALVERVRVYESNRWRLFEKVTTRDGRESWIVISEGRNPLGRVPIVTRYVRCEEPYVSKPALSGMAWLNLAHWQSYSDQRNLLRVARVPQLMIVGVSAEERDKESHIGMSRVWKSTNENARAFFVEHTGNAIRAGEEDLTKIEQRMQVLGLQPLVESGSNTTAAARTMDESRTHSKLGAWAMFTSGGLDEGFAFAAAWKGATLDPKFKSEIFNDFELSLQSAQDMQILLSMNERNKLSDATLLLEAKRRGVISERINVKDELDAAADNSEIEDDSEDPEDTEISETPGSPPGGREEDLD